MRKLAAVVVGIAVVAIATQAFAQLLLFGVGKSTGGGGGTCFFVPSQLESAQYDAVLDGSTVAWSGSTFGTTANPGSLGGNIVANDGTVVKGTQLNSLDTVAFSGSNSLKIVSKNWSGNVYVFGVFSYAASFILVQHGWQNATLPGTTGWAIYPRLTSDGTLFAPGSGSNAGQAVMRAGATITDTASHLESYQMGTANGYRQDGTPITLTLNTTGTVTSFTALDMVFGNRTAASPEFGIGNIAYLVVGNPPALATIQKLEGWAAARFGLQGSLPSSHPYKSVAPPCSPVISNPGSQSIAISTSTPIPGVSVAASEPGFSTISVNLSDSTGLLAATGTGVSGSGTTSLTINSSLANVNAALATLTDTNGTGGTDNITVTATDNNLASATPQVIPVTVTGSGCSQATTLLARMDGSQNTSAVTNLVCGLVSAGLYSTFDALYVFAINSTANANLNWASSSFNLTKVGTVTFNANQGYTPNGSTGYFTNAYTPSSSAVNVTQNSTTVGGCAFTNGGGSGSGPIFIATQNASTKLYLDAATPTSFYGVNDGTGGSVADGSGLGQYTATRTSSTGATLYRNGSSVSSYSVTSVGLPTVPTYVLGYNNNGAAIASSLAQHGAAFLASGWTGTQVSTFFGLLHTYMLAVSAPSGC